MLCDLLLGITLHTIQFESIVTYIYLSFSFFLSFLCFYFVHSSCTVFVLSSFRFPCTSAPRSLYWPLRPSKTSMARTDWEISCTRTLLTQRITSRGNTQPSLWQGSLRSIQVSFHYSYRGHGRKKKVPVLNRVPAANVPGYTAA